jgi:hypothetical protein
MAATQTRLGVTGYIRFSSSSVPAQAEILYSVKIVCGKQTDSNCCWVAGARPGI